MNVECLVLDAMGVVFRAADDVEELLIPFIRSHGGLDDAASIRSAYVAASLGAITADAFWLQVGLRPALEDDYLSGHALMSGVREVIQFANDRGMAVWLLSNDVERWSRKLRAAFALDAWLSGAVISSDACARKPDVVIYRYFMQRSGYDAADVVFVDDREKNVAAAAAVGICAVRFVADTGFDPLTHLLRGSM